MGKYTSSNERIIEKLENIHLTEDRIIKKTKSGVNVDYKDIQLDKILGFNYEKKLDQELLVISGLFGLFGFSSLLVDKIPTWVSTGSIIASIIVLIVAFAAMSKHYVIKTDNPEVKMTIDNSENVFEFWQKINDQRNSGNF